ncbi:MAG: hypothetical protein ABI353_21030 [Isosphaeraceae bacterium]
MRKTIAINHNELPNRKGLDHAIRSVIWDTVAVYSRIEGVTKTEIRRKVIEAAASALDDPDTKFSWNAEMASFGRHWDDENHHWVLPEVAPDTVFSGPFRLFLRNHRTPDEIAYLCVHMIERVERNLDLIGFPGADPDRGPSAS